MPVLSNLDRTPRIPKALKMCNGCDNYVYEEEVICTFCKSDIQKVNEEYAQKLQRAILSLEKLELLMMK